MQYLLLIYADEKLSANMDKAQLDAQFGEYMAFGKEFETSIIGGNPLQPIAKAQTVRVRDGKSLTTDGPFAETKEQLGGYYLVDVASADEALRMAAKIPGARHGSIEVRPILKF